MCNRKELVRWRVTSVGQKIPENAVELTEEDMQNEGYLSNLANMDETILIYLEHQLLTDEV